MKSTNRLSYENQWEAHEYRVGGKLIKTLKSVVIGDKTYKVSSFMDHRTYSDMGTPGSATTPQYTIDVEFEGAKLPVTLNLLISKKVKIDAKDFELDT